MATASAKGQCVTCGKERSAVICGGCQQIFCYTHFPQHRQQLSEQLDEIEINRDLFRQTLNEQIQHPQQHALIKQIDQWESESIRKIQQTAQQCKQMVLGHANEHLHQIEVKLSKLTDQLKQIRQEDDYNEADLNQLKQKLTQLTKELNQIPYISLERDSSLFIKKISVIISSAKTISSVYHINNNAKWKQAGLTVAGGNGKGNGLNQLSSPIGFYIDDDHQCIYIADPDNHRIVEWKYGATIGQVVAGGNGEGSQINQLNHPTDVLVDKSSNSFIICDFGNRRVVRWSRDNSALEETLISDISCVRLTMDNNGDLYVSERDTNEVRCYGPGEINKKRVIIGNGPRNQFNNPTNIFVDQDYSIYVSDHGNHRIVKWIENANEEIVVAGGNGQGDSLMQLNKPNGVIVDALGNIYVADSGNHRVMCWPKGSKAGRLVVGGNGRGQRSNQFSWPMGLSFDRYGNMYVADSSNQRVQKFDIDLS